MKNHQDKSVGKWISILYRQFQIYINRELKEYDINSSEYIYLANIAKNEGVCQKYFSDELMIDQALTTRVMKSLEKKGFITREKNVNDKRAYTIKLTPTGQNIQPLIIEKLNYWTKILSEGMETDEVDRLINQLQLMCENVLKETKGDNNE